MVGKAKRTRQRRAQRRTVIVDACEIGQYRGMLTLRAGVDNRPPARIAIPADTAAGVVDQLAEVSLDAEELYWQVVPTALAGVDRRDLPAVLAAMEKWLLGQDWAGVIDRIGEDGGPMFLISHVGHVGLVIAPPFTDRSTLAVFDPMQLRRLAPGLRSAVAAAHAEALPIVTPHTVGLALEFLARQPWPQPGYQGPTFEQAAPESQRRYQQFLARAPYQRAEEHNVENYPG